MRILHYSLGFPPFRRGGLTKYCVDLMVEQAKNNVVGMIWPGVPYILHRKIKVKQHKDYKVNSVCIKNYEFVGFLPVSLLDGIKDKTDFTSSINCDVYINFIKKFKPDVIHFHTIMGVPYEFVKFLNEAKIRTVFTTHDYFGICPKTTLTRIDGFICDGSNFDFCKDCNKTAFSSKKYAILQTGLYRRIKNSYFVKLIRKKHWKKTDLENTSAISLVKSAGNEYVELQNYYRAILNEFNFIHYNSVNTKKVYSVLELSNESAVIPITTNNINKNTIWKKVEEKVVFSYLGPKNYHKGYYLLKSVCDSLYDKGYQFYLNIYFDDEDSRTYLKSNKPYTYSEISKVYYDANCVVVPSIWNETFGFIVAESLANSTPVIVSNTVGSKDILDKSMGSIINPDFDSLYNEMERVIKNPKILDRFAECIEKNYRPKLIEEHCEEIYGIYKKIV